MQPIQGWEYDKKKYREAITKKELCKVDLVSLWGENPAYDKLSIEKMRKEYHEYCPKSKSNNIIICPQQIIKRKKDIRVQWTNDYFKRVGKKGRKRKTKRKGKKGRSNEKKRTTKRKKKTRKKKKNRRKKNRRKKKKNRRCIREDLRSATRKLWACRGT